ncbi:hypothetical protein BC941DRAFT_429787 [Chlamydoabsidia padenii]|nr:hypothetical protein BC941DRAFT_429787 [Chlamydoabsidia padenii]
MAPKRKSLGQKSEPKLFRCTGFGDCDMVFTRSEHLARHARKHTGEKPYKCVVPGCGRMFSRFDNMMQHTQTHNKQGHKKKDRRKSTNHAFPPSRFEKEPSPDDSLPFSHRSPPSMISSRTLPLPRRMSYHSSSSPPPLPHMDPPLFYRRGSLQSISSTSSSLSTESGRRRLSAADLQVPIHSFQDASNDKAIGGVVDISSDEYEALQGISKFYSQVHDDDSPHHPSPMLSAQVATFRQTLLPIQESCQRQFKSFAI